MKTPIQDKKQVFAPMMLKKSDDGIDGIIAGIANCTEMVDLGDDRILAGAFNKTLIENHYKFMLNIDHMRGLESEIGVGFFSMKGNDLILERGILNLNKAHVTREILPTLIQRQEYGIPAGLSIEYMPVKFRFVEENGVSIREISELKLYKISIVDNPMSQNADGTRGSFLDSIKSYKEGVHYKMDTPTTTEIKVEETTTAELTHKQAKKAKKAAKIAKLLLQNKEIIPSPISDQDKDISTTSIVEQKVGKPIKKETLDACMKSIHELGLDLTGYKAAHKAYHKSVSAHIANLKSILQPSTTPDDSQEPNDTDPDTTEDCGKSAVCLPTMAELILAELQKQSA